MSQFKFYSAEVRRFGEPAVIITSSFTNPGGYPRAESFVLIPDAANTLLANRLSFDVKSFDGTPVDLNEEFMLAEALGQARIDLLLYLQKKAEEGSYVVSGGPMILDSTFNSLIGPQFRGAFPQLADVQAKTELKALADLLAWVLKLPKINVKPL